MKNAIPVRQAMKEFGKKDQKSFLRWCKGNGIRPFKIGKPWYIYREEFEAAISKQLESAGKVINIEPEVKQEPVPILQGYTGKSPLSKGLLDFAKTG